MNLKKLKAGPNPSILIVFAGIHFGLVYLGNEFYFEPTAHVATLWPASGWFMGMLMVYRARLWPAFILAGTGDGQDERRYADLRQGTS